MVLLKVNKSSHEDIESRIIALGPIYTRDFLINSMEHGTIIAFGEVGLVIEPERIRNDKLSTKKRVAR